MSTAPTTLTVFQSGVESTKGTPVAATTQVAVETFDFVPIDELNRPALVRGLLARSQGDETMQVRGVNWTASGPLLLSQAQHWLNMAVLADAVPVGAGDPYTWTHTWDPTALPTVNSRTFERRLSDGTNFDDDEFAYSMCNSLTISGGTNDLLRYEASGFARRRQGSTLTAGQTLPTVATMEPTALTRVYLDTSWANLGNTIIAAQILDFSVTFRNGYRPQMALDARTDLDFSVALVNSREVGIDVTLTMLVDTNTAQYSVEQTAAEAGSLRALRIENIATGTRNLTMDMLVKHVAGSLLSTSDQDGVQVVTMALQESTDGTNMFSAVLLNAEATLV